MIDRLRRHPASDIALVAPATAGRIGYGELLARAETTGRALRDAAPGDALVFLALRPDIDAVAAYLACWSARLPVCLVEPDPAPLERLTDAYAPDLLLLPGDLAPPDGYETQPLAGGTMRAWRRAQRPSRSLHPDLALLLTTSGSTGSPKLVRLTMRNLESNASAIAEYLAIGREERAIASLPLHYSYGLSVLHSHLFAGASVVLTPHSFMRPEFWSAFDAERCTSFAGVPYMYETLHRLRFDPARHPTLRTLTQAGGGLRSELIAHFQRLTQAAGIRFVVMYGQTEATARISFVPPDVLERKIGSIGIAIPGGRLHLAPVEDLAGAMELVYEGPNVMMGYAEGAADLAEGDVLHGVLRTGDLGAVDDDGYYRVVGRLTRFAKLFGRRVSLADIENVLEATFPVRVAATDGGDRIVLHLESLGAFDLDALSQHVVQLLSVPPGAVVTHLVARLPRTSSGKKDYRALETVS